MSDTSHPSSSEVRTAAVVATFALAADLAPREGRSYGEWVQEVTVRFSRAWVALEGSVR